MKRSHSFELVSQISSPCFTFSFRSGAKYSKSSHLSLPQAIRSIFQGILSSAALRLCAEVDLESSINLIEFTSL
ncbi:TPA: hypothetical protein DEG21_02965 [Patescibacteria group bacterium]|nr:hypothetical protein [Candidatus Gracilibacteria bacterium]HBY74831.1 hypothetical protein [Candidatus Gracilibacteria bacterium]